MAKVDISWYRRLSSKKEFQIRIQRVGFTQETYFLSLKNFLKIVHMRWVGFVTKYQISNNLNNFCKIGLIFVLAFKNKKNWHRNVPFYPSPWHRNGGTEMAAPKRRHRNGGTETAASNRPASLLNTYLDIISLQQ